MPLPPPCDLRLTTIAPTTLAPPSHLRFGGGHSAPTFVDMPLDVFLNICEWLSVRDMLALRMVNKHQICVEA